MRPSYVGQYEDLERRHWWWQARRALLRTVLRPPSRPGAPRPRLLDLGCGSGITLACLADRFECVGMEPDPFLRERARANTQAPIRAGALPFELPNWGRRFEVVLLLDVLEHIADDAAALGSVARLLAPGGQLLLNVPAMPWMWSVHDEINGHQRRYTAGGLRRLLEAAQLEIVQMRHWGCLLLPAAFLERRLRWRRAEAASYQVSIPPAPLNRALRALVLAEFRLFGRRGAPAGLSLLAVAQRPMSEGRA